MVEGIGLWVAAICSEHDQEIPQCGDYADSGHAVREMAGRGAMLRRQGRKEGQRETGVMIAKVSWGRLSHVRLFRTMRPYELGRATRNGNSPRQRTDWADQLRVATRHAFA